MTDSAGLFTSQKEKLYAIKKHNYSKPRSDYPAIIEVPYGGNGVFRQLNQVKIEPINNILYIGAVSMLASNDL
jgi:hypothetical protein